MTLTTLQEYQTIKDYLESNLVQSWEAPYDEAILSGLNTRYRDTLHSIRCLQDLMDNSENYKNAHADNLRQEVKDAVYDHYFAETGDGKPLRHVNNWGPNPV